MDPVAFKIKFPIEQIEHWAGLYRASEDDEALISGAKIRAGDHSRANLEKIALWKSPRRVGLIAQNSDSEIEEALRLALTASVARSSFGVLMGLSGVGVPMASAILTAIDQERYRIIDYRALDTLSVPNMAVNLNFYLIHYFPECQRLASKAGTDLRTLDRALWAWSREQERHLNTGAPAD